MLAAVREIYETLLPLRASESIAPIGPKLSSLSAVLKVSDAMRAPGSETYERDGAARLVAYPQGGRGGRGASRATLSLALVSRYEPGLAGGNKPWCSTRGSPTFSILRPLYDRKYPV